MCLRSPRIVEGVGVARAALALPSKIGDRLRVFALARVTFARSGTAVSLAAAVPSKLGNRWEVFALARVPFVRSGGVVSAALVSVASRPPPCK